MTTVFAGLVAIAERLPRTVRGIATGGGAEAAVPPAPASLYVDDLLLLTDFADDAFIRGTLLLETGACAGAVLPITDSVQGSGRVLGAQRWWLQVASEEPAAGDLYLITAGLYGAAQLLLALREALRSWGMVEKREELGSGDGATTTFWSMTHGEITRLELVKEDSGDITEVSHWAVVPEGIVLQSPPPDDVIVQALVRYAAEDAVLMPPSRSTLDDDLGDIPAEFLGYYGAFAAVRAALAAPGQDQEIIIKVMNYYSEQAEVARNRYQGRGLHGREIFMR